MLDKRDLEKLAELARIKVDKTEEDGLLNDLRLILSHFEELKEVDTEKINFEEEKIYYFFNELREDEMGDNIDPRLAKEAFPEKKNDFLSIPLVFE
jgi:aspartyl/glutamyl-tRNA(Asn/Gln) amidotransferase C subunit